MAYTKIIVIHDRLDLCINYVLNDDKTKDNHVRYQGAINCSLNKAYKQMKDTKDLYGSKGSIKGYHIIQSFAPDEIEPKTAHEVGQKFVKLYLGDYEVVFSTHVDKSHIHNHIAFNSVSFVDGKKYRSNKSTYYNGIRKVSDELCREYGLSVIEPDMENTNLSYAEWLGEKTDKVTWNKIIKDDIDNALKECYSFGEFLFDMEYQGYQIKEGKYLSFRPYGKERFVRGKTLGDDYAIERIRARIEGNEYTIVTKPLFNPIQKTKTNKTQYMPDIIKRYWHWVYSLNLVKKRQAPRKQSKYFKAELLKFEKYKEQQNFILDNGLREESIFYKYQNDLEEQLEIEKEKLQPIKREITKYRTEFKAMKDIAFYKKPYELYMDGHDVMMNEYNNYIAAVVVLEKKGYDINDLSSLKDKQADLYNQRSYANQNIQGIKNKLRICDNIVKDMKHIEEKERRVEVRKKERGRIR